MNNPKKYALHLILFLVTLFTTTLAGAEWINGKLFFLSEEGWGFGTWVGQAQLIEGLHFSVPFLLFLTCHEFGHYFMAMYHRVKVSLPYYIPLWLGFSFTIGTMGAFIQIKERLRTRTQFFDIGIAGPLAGFVVAMVLLIYGFTHLPPPEHLLKYNPHYVTDYPEEYAKYGNNFEQYAYKYPDKEPYRKLELVGKDIEGIFGVGKNLMFLIFEEYVVQDKSRIPHRYELIHYPYLFAGFLALLFTALNLIPIGQLDGGHILYGLIGYRWHKRLSPVFFVIFVFYAGMGLISPYWANEDLLYAIPMYLFFLFLLFQRVLPDRRSVLLLSLSIFALQFVMALFFPKLEGYSGWLVFCFLLGRVLGVYHPPAMQEKPLSTGRKILGWLSLLIFVLCFSPKPFIFE